MSIPPLRAGRDTHVLSSKPQANFGTARHPLLRSGKSRGLLSWPALQALVRRKTVASAMLYPRVYGAWPNTGVTVAPLKEGWAASAVTWQRQPDVRGTLSASAQSGAVADGGRFPINVTALVSAIAAGAEDYGWRVTVDADADRFVHGFDSESAGGGWLLEVTLVEPSGPPAALVPSGGSIGVSKWVCSVDDSDAGDGESTIAAIRVQVDADEDDVSPDFDSGWVPATEAELALAGTSYAGLAAGASTAWRANLRDSGGVESGWSDWSDQITHRPYVSGQITSPAGTSLTDATTILEAAVGAPVVAYQWLITSGADRSQVRLDTQKTQAPTGTTISTAVPARNTTGQVVMPTDGGTYQVGFRWWDRTDRVASPGDPAYREVWRTVTLNEAANPAPATLSATQVGASPLIKLRWTRANAADQWLVLRDGIRVAVIDHADVTPDGAGAWSWLDQTAQPWTRHLYEMRAVEKTGTQAGESAKSPTAAVTAKVEGVWFIRRDGRRFVIESDDGVAGLELMYRRAVYSPPGLDHDVYVTTAPPFLAGPIVGVIAEDDDTGQPMREAIAEAVDLAGRPAETVQLVAGTLSIPIRFTAGPRVLPRQGFFELDQSHDFTCTVQQVGGL